jgi:hypothetical protein
MSDAPKKRPWLRFHLSTAVVLMFVASGLLWLNLRQWERLGRYHDFGFPFVAVEYGPPETLRDEVPPLWKWEYDATALLADVALQLSALILVSFASEWRIRRRPWR